MSKPSAEQIFIADQTAFIESLLYTKNVHPINDTGLINYVKNNKEYFDENGNEVDEDADYDDFNYTEIYKWLLVSPKWKDKVKEMGCPYLEYMGQMWVGQSFMNSAWENTNYWKVFE